MSEPKANGLEKINTGTTQTVWIGSDHAGFELKSQLVALLTNSGLKVQDVGTHSSDSVDYPDIANLLCPNIPSGTQSQTLGVLICGSGIGISIAANRWPHIRAALCESVATAKKSREHNQANVLCLGGQVVTNAIAAQMLEAFLTATPDTSERHLRRISKLSHPTPTKKGAPA